jgi:hypothetical protein
MSRIFDLLQRIDSGLSQHVTGAESESSENVAPTISFRRREHSASEHVCPGCGFAVDPDLLFCARCDTFQGATAAPKYERDAGVNTADGRAPQKVGVVGSWLRLTKSIILLVLGLAAIAAVALVIAFLRR